MNVLPTCVHAYRVHTVPVVARRGSHYPGIGVRVGCESPCQVWEVELRFSVRTTKALNHQAISPAPWVNFSTTEYIPFSSATGKSYSSVGKMYVPRWWAVSKSRNSRWKTQIWASRPFWFCIVISSIPAVPLKYSSKLKVNFDRVLSWK